MDAQEIAQAVLLILTPYIGKAGEAFASEVGGAVWGLTERLFNRVKTQFANPADKQILTEFVDSPEAEISQERFENLLSQKLADDQDLLNEITKLLKQMDEVTEPKNSSSDAPMFITVAQRINQQFNIDKVEGGIHFTPKDE